MGILLSLGLQYLLNNSRSNIHCIVYENIPVCLYEVDTVVPGKPKLPWLKVVDKFFYFPAFA